MREHLQANWAQGEHLSIIAPTGRGKTTIAVAGLLPLWEYKIILDGKGADPMLNAAGKRVARYPSGILARLDEAKSYVIQPPLGRATPDSTAAATFRDTMDEVWRGRNWTVYIDELRLFSDRKYYDLGEDLDRLWLFGRSRGLTLIAGTQAPRFVPAAFYEQPRHFLISYVRDLRALKRLEEIGGDTDAIRQTVPDLEPFEFLYVGPEGMARSRLELSAVRARKQAG